jgi:hypothetical protein
MARRGEGGERLRDRETTRPHRPRWRQARRAEVKLVVLADELGRVVGVISVV